MIRPVLLITAAALLCACDRREEPAPQAPPADASATAPASDTASGTDAPMTARAVVNPTSNNTATGELTLTADQGAVRVTGQLTGLKPNSEHAVHVHEKGDCSAPDASSAGEHFNPTQQPHGNPDVPEHHAGDMYNVSADDKGSAQVDTRAVGATLRDGGSTDLAGKAVVVHEKPDDYKTQPSGGSGARIACGVIE
ncbi:MAG TPA: superoxide dismutase family protein [Steroidobacteraceae bacterium]|nr:superoxide dismutase family protein [Steroidobacteraceae bacterium]